jgi:hypothetical protein
MIHDERVGSKIEVLKVVEAGKDADEELDQFVLGRVGAGALSEWDRLQALKQTEVLGKLAEEDQSSMVSGQVEGQIAVRVAQPWRWMDWAQREARIGREDGRSEALGRGSGQAGKSTRGGGGVWHGAVDERMGRE